MRRPLLWVLLLLLGLALLVLASGYEEAAHAATVADELRSLAYGVGVLVLTGGAALTIFRKRFAYAVETSLLWLVLALVLVFAYAYRFELEDVARRVMIDLVPDPATTGERTVEIARTHSGDFRIATHVNGARVPMVLDTGASAVVLTHEAAKAAGLPLELVKYTVPMETANGRTLAAPVTLDRIAVGRIVERSVPALIVQPGQLRVSLLGMSFLNRLQSWEVRGTRVTMRGYP